MFPRMQKSVREWTFTLPSELPFWELESQWILKFLEGDCKGQNSLDWNVPYTILNPLECRCLKWARIPFGHLKHKLWLKEGPRVKLAIWLLTTKSRESPRFPCMQVACNILLKSSRRGLQLCFRLHLNWRSTDKVMGPQNCKNLNFGNFGTPTWASWDKMSFGCGPHGKARSIL